MKKIFVLVLMVVLMECVFASSSTQSLFSRIQEHQRSVERTELAIKIGGGVLVAAFLLLIALRGKLGRHGEMYFLVGSVVLVAGGVFVVASYRPSPGNDELREERRKDDYQRPHEALVQAAEWNDAKAVKKLLSSGISSKLAWELLLVPRSHGHCSLVAYDIKADIVRLFLDSGASLDAAMSNYDILWKLCAGPCYTANCEDVVRLFLERGGDSLKRRRDSPIGGLGSVDTINGHHVAIVRLLLDKGDDPSRARGILKSLSERQKTSHDCGVEILGLLLRNRKWSAEDLSDALDSALRGCRFESCRQAANLLLENGAPVPKDAANVIRALNESLGEGQCKDVIVTQKLIRHLGGRIDPAKKISPSLRDEVEDRKKVRMLHDDFARGVYRFANGPSLLNRAIDDGAEIDAVDKQGNVPLVSLIKSPWTGTNLMALVGIMIERGAKLNTAGDWGETPLAVAVERFDGKTRIFSDELVAILLKAGADPLAHGKSRSHCALESAFGLSSTTGKVELVRTLLDAVSPAPQIPTRVLISAAKSDFGQENEAQRLAFVQELIQCGAPVTDAAVCAGWWDTEVRKALLAKSSKRESDYVASECGSVRIVRAIPKTPADEVTDRRQVESMKRHHESMLEHERHFANHRHFAEFVDMDRRRIEDAVDELQRLRDFVLSRASEGEKSSVEARMSVRAAEESNRVMRVFAMLDAATNGTPESAIMTHERQDRKKAWSQVEAGMAAHGVADYQLRSMRLEYEVETVRWERMVRDREQRRNRQDRDKEVEKLVRWLRERVYEEDGRSK